MAGIRESFSQAAQWAKEKFILNSPVMVSARGARTTIDTVEKGAAAVGAVNQAGKMLSRFLPWGLGAAVLGGLFLTFKDKLFGSPEPKTEPPQASEISTPVYTMPDMPPPAAKGEWVSRVEKKAVPESFAACESPPASYAAAEELRHQETSGQSLGT